MHASFRSAFTAIRAIIAPAALLMTSGCAASAGDSESGSGPGSPLSSTEAIGPFQVSHHANFEEPWAAAFQPGTSRLFVTEKGGTLKFYDTDSGETGSVGGVPKVDYGGQGGLGDIAFAPNFAETSHIYLSWVEAGGGDTRGAVLGRGMLSCGTNIASISDSPIASSHSATADGPCTIAGLKVIWRQIPKVTGKGHYSHRLSFSPDGQYLFIASGERQKMEPAQNITNTLGTIVRLTLDGEPAAGNPFADQGAPANQIWSYGHRNILGMDFDASGQLWEVEHGPRGGDELNLVRRGANYGWPLVSDGEHYNGNDIPNNRTRPDLAQSALTWTPVIAPSDMIFVESPGVGGWKGDALIAGLSSNALIHVDFDGEKAREIARYDFGARLRVIVEEPTDAGTDMGTDMGGKGTFWVLEDGEEGRLLKLRLAS